MFRFCPRRDVVGHCGPSDQHHDHECVFRLSTTSTTSAVPPSDQSLRRRRGSILELSLCRHWPTRRRHLHGHLVVAWRHARVPTNIRAGSWVLRCGARSSCDSSDDDADDRDACDVAGHDRLAITIAVISAALAGDSSSVHSRLPRFWRSQYPYNPRIMGVYRFRPRIVGFRNDFCLSCRSQRRGIQVRTFNVVALKAIPLIPVGFWKHWQCASCARDPGYNPRSRRTFAITLALLGAAFAAVFGGLQSNPTRHCFGH